MIKLDKKEICSGCSACEAACPMNCITMIPDKLGFLYPVINNDTCTNCGICEAICPALSKTVFHDTIVTEAYAAYNKDNCIRERSSSGGIFTLIAQYILSQGGVVFGAAFDDTFNTVKHISVENQEWLYKLQGSKYVQSEIGRAYIEVEEHLKQGRLVLFSGTPCQISGLKAYLRKDYYNLYLQDIVCHGVPSPAVWEKYVTHLECRIKGKLIRASFRDKQNGWKNYALRFKFNNGKEYIKKRTEDLFMRGFLHDYYLRPSCYECVHKGVERESDITLADYWGVESIHPHLDDDKGISLVTIHSAKGKELFEKICNDICLEETDIDIAVKFNSSMITSAKLNDGRISFEEEFGSKPINELLTKYCKISVFRRIIRKIKIISRLK